MISRFNDQGLEVTPFEREAIEKAINLHSESPLKKDGVRKEIAITAKGFFRECEINIMA